MDSRGALPSYSYAQISSCRAQASETALRVFIAVFTMLMTGSLFGGSRVIKRPTSMQAVDVILSKPITISDLEVGIAKAVALRRG